MSVENPRTQLSEARNGVQPLFTHERRQQIIQMLGQQQRVTVPELSQAGFAKQAQHGQYAAGVQQQGHFDQRLLERHMVQGSRSRDEIEPPIKSVLQEVGLDEADRSISCEPSSLLDHHCVLVDSCHGHAFVVCQEPGEAATFA